MTHYGIATDYDRNEGRKRDYLTVWSGPFLSTYEASAVSLPRRDGYMVTTNSGEKIRVSCPVGRADDNWLLIDNAISDALSQRS